MNTLLGWGVLKEELGLHLHYIHSTPLSPFLNTIKYIPCRFSINFCFVFWYIKKYFFLREMNTRRKVADNGISAKLLLMHNNLRLFLKNVCGP